MGSAATPWGPTVDGGRPRSRRRRALWVVALVCLAAVAGVAATAATLYRHANESVTRLPVEQLTDPEASTDGSPSTDGAASSDARTFLIVGSDSRAGVDHEGVATGDVDGQRSDAILYVAFSEDREDLSVLSLPRDLHVERDGRARRLGETFRDGPGELVATVQEDLGLPVHHYAEVGFDGFIDAVDTLGGVELCLEDDLVDADAGADLEAGCHHRSPEDALAFVRSRQGDRADLARIERQQQFVRATLEELSDRRLLTDVPRLFDLVEDVAGNVTTDDRLELREMLVLADEVREIVDDDVPMATLPARPEAVDGRELLVPYGPGARAMVEELRSGGTLSARATGEQRQQTTVAIWSRHRDEGMSAIASTLLFSGFTDRYAAGPGPTGLEVGSTTTVFAGHDARDAAERVAAVLGAPIRSLPAGTDLPDGADVAVGVGRDATGTMQDAPRLLGPGESIESRLR